MKKGWVAKRLGDFAAAVSTGPFGSILHKSDYVDDGVPLVNPVNIVGDSIVPDPSKLISEVTIKRLSNYVLVEGDVVVGRRGEIGRCAVVGPNEIGWVCGTGCFFIRPLPSLDSQFLTHLIRSPEYREQLEKLSTGATMKNLSNTALGDLVVSIPPLPEQHRIVRLLDEAFEGLDTAKANAEKNLQNARALFESHLQSVFSQRGPGWVEHTLGDLIEIQNGYAFKSTDYTDAGHFVIRISNVQDGEITLANPRFIQLADKKLERFILNDGDILVSLTGNIGRVGMIQEDHLPAVLNQRVARITVKGQAAERNFLFRFLLSGSFREGLQEAGHGAAQQNVSTKEIEAVRISLPNKREQLRLVEEFDSFAEQTQRLTSLYEQKLAALEALKKSLLHQAFAGEL
jgi:type I restriction enzyme S subunit